MRFTLHVDLGDSFYCILKYLLWNCKYEECISSSVIDVTIYSHPDIATTNVQMIHKTNVGVGHSESAVFMPSEGL